MLKILYLEDNKFDIDLTKIEIKKNFSDCEIDIANTINDAVQLLKANQNYDVAILDLNLPDGNGIDCLSYIRLNNLQIAVIILTGSGNEESAIAALKAGADDYLAKKEGYLKKLTNTINGVIENFKENFDKRARQLRVLYIEWNKHDVDFTIRHMKKYAPQIQIENIEIASDALKILPDSPNEPCLFDVILLDYRMPGLNAIDTIKAIRKEKKLTIPIVLVTGHGSEEVAVQALKLGADEYLVKRDNYLFRLPSLLLSAYHRYELEQKQKLLRESESKYRLLAENSKDVIFILNLDLKYTYISPSVTDLRGFEVEEVLQQNLSDVLTPNSYQKILQLLEEIKPQLNSEHYKEVKPQVLELEMIKKDKSTVWTEVKVSLLGNEKDELIGIQGAVRDISKRKQALQELMESREEYRSFFDDDLTGDFISHVNGQVINCNNAYLKILGFESFLDAKNYSIIQLYFNPEKYESMLEKLKLEKKLIWFEQELIRKDGKIINVVANIIGGFNKNGELETIKEYIIDDTERKMAIEELRKFSRAIEQSPVSIVITNLEGNIEYVNPKFSEVTGYSYQESLGQNPRILKSDTTPAEVYSTLWKTLKSDKIWTGQFLNKRKDGTYFWEFASISPVKNDKGITTHFLAIKEDITEKKKYEEELIVARDQAQESNRLKSAFLATMSHELRTPLNAIIGFSDLINDNLPMENVIQFCKIINSSGNHLLNIIEDIFSISLLQTGQSKLFVEEFTLSDFFNSLAQYAGIELNNRDKNNLKISFKSNNYDIETRIRTDKTKLFQILINYIKNAIEYTEKGEIEIGYLIRGNDLEFYVKDTGIGIPQDKMDIIFDRFRQIDETYNRIHGGVGLGLAICSEIAKLLKGEIRAESVERKGSTFYFLLKNIIQNNDLNSANNSKTNYPDLKGKTILIVEDEETNYFLLKEFLKKSGATIIWVKNGEDSIEICKTNAQIHLVLMDIRLSGIDGLEASKRIKTIRPNLKIIAQTAFAFSNDRKIIMSSFCDDYLPKPIKFNDLMNAIKIQMEI
ncbi:MAG TPA: response regulator [Draconibacterium sp.]|nr:response regulator [Draconibacterium sp.]